MSETAMEKISIELPTPILKYLKANFGNVAEVWVRNTVIDRLASDLLDDQNLCADIIKRYNLGPIFQEHGFVVKREGLP